MKKTAVGSLLLLLAVSTQTWAGPKARYRRAHPALHQALQLKLTAQQLYHNAEAYSYGRSRKGRRALRQLHKLQQRAHELHRYVGRYGDGKRVRRAYRKMENDYYRFKSQGWYPGEHRHVRRDFRRMDKLIGNLNTYYGNHYERRYDRYSDNERYSDYDRYGDDDRYRDYDRYDRERRNRHYGHGHDRDGRCLYR